jgi:hypothetical protein
MTTAFAAWHCHARTFLYRYLIAGAGLLCIVQMTACSKSTDNATDPDPVVTGDTMFNRVITVLNFGEDLPTGSQPLDEQAAIYFSLETKSAINTSFRKTNRWDITFSSIFRSFIGGNNGINTSNLGYGGPAKGGIMIVDKAFTDVVDIPSDDQFKTGSVVVGTDDAGAFGAGMGYYLYDYDGVLMSDGSSDMQHVAYAIADTMVTKTGLKLNPRTIIVKTADGHYAKIKIMSIYKDLLDPATWRKTSPHPFFSFQYVLAKAGSKKFEIK